MKLNCLTLLAALPLTVLWACASPPPSTAARPAADPAAAPSPSGGAEPLNRYAENRTAEAMRGLTYASGRVEIDPAEAAKVVDHRDATEAAATFARAQQLLSENMHTEALAAATRAVLLNPDEPSYYVGLGRALDAKGKTSESLAAFRTALDRMPDSIETRIAIAETIQKLGDFAASADAWRDVIAVDPANGRAYARLAVLEYYLEDFAAAWDAVHAAEGLDEPVPPQLRELLASRMPEPAGN